MKYFILISLVFLSVQVSAREKIKVGVDYNFPPYSFIDENGNEAGYDIEVIKAIAKELDIEVEFRFAPWQEILDSLSYGDIDIVAGIVYSQERENIYDFTFPLQTEYYSIFTDKRTDISDINDLESKKPAFLEGEISNNQFLRPMNLLKDSVPVKSLPDAFTKIIQGECDYVIAPYPLGMKIIDELNMKTIKAKGPSVTQNVFCFAVKEGDDELLSKLNLGIEHLSRNGKLDQIHEKWIKYKHKDDQYKVRYKYTLVILFCLLVVVIVLTIFWYSLKMQFNKKVQQIKYTEELYYKVFNSVDDILLVLNKNGQIVDANLKALDVCKVSHSELVGKLYIDVIGVKDIGSYQKAISSQGNEYNYFDIINKEINSVVYWFKVRVVKLRINNAGQYMAILHDISDEKRSIMKLEKANKLADEANSAKNTFLATISHEIRTPLNAIIGYSEIIAKTSLNEKQSKYNKRIGASSGMLLNLVNNVLDITKIDAKKLVINKQPFSIKKVVTTICDIQKHKAIEQGLNLYLKYDDDIPTVLLGDELRLTQILLNILSNAIKFTHNGYVSLSVGIESKETVNNSDGLNIVFSVKDTGNGISDSNIDRLFKPFEQLQRYNGHNYGGTGLGLAISKQLADLMGGDILVESTSGKGSTFIISIPFKKCNKKLKNILVDNKDKEIPNIEFLSILMVEDNYFNAEVLTELMAELNRNITHVDSGLQAIEAIKNHKYDLVLMDIEMPGINGFETAKRIRQLDNGKHTPILALSANSLDSEKQKALDIGMNNYMCKPVNIDELTNTIVNSIDSGYIEFINSDLYKQGIDFFDGNKEKYNNTLIRFYENFSSAPESLIHLNKTNGEKLTSLAHNLKSALEMIGAKELSNKVRSIEKSLLMNKAIIDELLIKSIADELKRILKEIKTYV